MPRAKALTASAKVYFFHGKLSAAKPHRYGVRLRYDLMKIGPFATRKEAECGEKAVAEALTKRGHRVFWG